MVPFFLGSAAFHLSPFWVVLLSPPLSFGVVRWRIQLERVLLAAEEDTYMRALGARAASLRLGDFLCLHHSQMMYQAAALLGACLVVL